MSDTGLHRYRSHTCGALRREDVATPHVFQAGCIACATMAVFCSSICVITTA
jgi:hypothetical protein